MSQQFTGWRFEDRHIGPDQSEIQAMCADLGVSDIGALIESTVPASIRVHVAGEMPPAASEAEALAELRTIAEKNKVFRSYLGQGYYGCFTPPVIQRGILENPGWYTQYTPYQAEIAQGRLEALLNFQTMVADLTGLPVANASLLDEGTAAAEAMGLCWQGRKNAAANVFLVSKRTFPQTVEVVRARAEAMGIRVVVAETRDWKLDASVFGALIQYPDSVGKAEDLTKLVSDIHSIGALAVAAADPLALVLLRSPGEMGFDVAVGTTQRFGVPMGYGGPHAAYFATKEEHQRKLPGRIVGVSKDRDGRKALRLSLQTREQHIRREKATSNICTAQVLLAVMAGMYAVYHGPRGLRAIAERTHGLTAGLQRALRRLGFSTENEDGAFFDTLMVRTPGEARAIVERAAQERIWLQSVGSDSVLLSLDETTSDKDVQTLVSLFAGKAVASSIDPTCALPKALLRTSKILTHSVFESHRSETGLMRYLKELENKDLSLTHSMIPLGSCTMKLNAAAELYPVSWREFSQMHPFAPAAHVTGYHQMLFDLETWLGSVTGLDAVSLQPNSGAQGEYAGLLVIRAYHRSRKEEHRNVCLIPRSAHGTNPASAAMAGFEVVAVACDEIGNIDVADLRAKAVEHADRLGALMVTYPSTHGVFETSIQEISKVVHEHGGQVYLDGANLNALCGIARPSDLGADVCHMNLHKTFCIPHGGGGPGMGPIAARAHLAPFLPGHPAAGEIGLRVGGETGVGPVSAGPWGSASILPISWMYLRMMGWSGLKRATQVAILNANYIAEKLHAHYPVLYRGKNGRVAHECILDLRGLKKEAGIEVEDVAKRLMDYGFHAPTVSWPVAGTVMVEPTESESKAEMDRFIRAMIGIREEAKAIAEGKYPRDNNPLKNAPHTAEQVIHDGWDRPYTRETAAYPNADVRRHKFWPAVARIDNVWGDRNLFCTCPPVEDTK